MRVMVVVFLAGWVSAVTATSMEEAVPFLMVEGQGTVWAEPDRAVLRLGAEMEADQAALAQEAVNRAMQKTVAALRGVGVPEERIGTTGIVLSPIYRPLEPEGRGEERRIAGYRAYNSVRVVLSDLSRVAEAIDAGVGAGANRVEDLTFELHDDAEARQRALRMAASQAMGKAQAMADALGVTLGQLLEAVEGGARALPPLPYGRSEMALRMEAADAAPVQPGQLRVEASVALRYQLLSGVVAPAGP